MKYMTLREITAACGGTYFGDAENAAKEVSSVVIDSRKVEKDSLFIAIRGARVDGHTFIPQTMKDGALAAVSEENLGDVPYPYILVDSCEQALKDIAEHYRRSLDIKVVGISGSVGKTSTKEMIASVLSQKYNVLKTAGNFNNEIGLPLTIFNIREEHEIAVLEMGISHFGEMARLAKIARPDICVITNIGYAHMENLKSRDGILKAKTEMFAYMNPDGYVIFNGDDDKLAGYVPENKVPPTYFGLNESRPFHALHIEDRGMRGTMVTFVTPDSSFTAHISVPGGHMVYNALAATAVGYALGMTDAQIKAGIEALVPLAGRGRLIETDKFAIIDDCYNANPASMKSSLDVLAKAEERKVAILGDMFELGENEINLHHEIGAYAVEIGIDVLVCIGALSRHMAAGAEKALAKARGNDIKTDENGTTTREDKTMAGKTETDIFYFESKADFFARLGQILNKKDMILVKASHGMEFTEIIDVLENY